MNKEFEKEKLESVVDDWTMAKMDVAYEDMKDHKFTYEYYKYSYILCMKFTLKNKKSEMDETLNANKPYFICISKKIRDEDLIEVTNMILLVSGYNPAEYKLDEYRSHCIEITKKTEEVK